MPTGRLNMRRIRDVLRLKFSQGLSERDIAASLGIGKGSVGNYIRRAQSAQLGWPLPEGLDDDSLELLLFPASQVPPDLERPIPDWVVIDRELRRPRRNAAATLGLIPRNISCWFCLYMVLRSARIMRLGRAAFGRRCVDLHAEVSRVFH